MHAHAIAPVVVFHRRVVGDGGAICPSLLIFAQTFQVRLNRTTPS